MLHRSPTVAVLLCSLAAAPAGAQDQGGKPDLAPRLALLQKALLKMAALPSCNFTIAQQNQQRLAGGANAARLPRAGAQVAIAGAAGGGGVVTTPQVSSVAGGWADDLLWASGDDGKESVVFRGRRMIARHGEGPWQLRQGVVGEGRPMPRPLDAETFFTVLARGKVELIHAEVGDLDDRPVEILTVHAAGDDAFDLLWSGLVPDAQTNSMIPARSAVAAVRTGRKKPETDIDVAVWLDPATARVLQIAIRCYSTSTATAIAMVAGPAGAGAPPAAGGAGLGPPAAEPAPAEQPADPLLVFLGGLPQRKPKDQQQLAVVSYDIVFRDHDAAKPPGLDAAASELLGLPAK